MDFNPQPDIPEEFADIIRRTYGGFDDPIFVIETRVVEAQMTVGDGMFTFPVEDIVSPFLFVEEIEISLRAGLNMDIIFVEPCLDVNEDLKLGRWKTSKNMYSYVIHNGWNRVRVKPENRLQRVDAKVRIWAFSVGERLGFVMANVLPEGLQRATFRDVERRGNAGNVDNQLGRQRGTNLEAPRTGSQENVTDVHAEQRRQESVVDVRAEEYMEENVVNVHAEQWLEEIIVDVNAEQWLEEIIVDVNAETGRQEGTDVQGQVDDVSVQAQRARI